MLNILINGEQSTFCYDGLAGRASKKIKKDLKAFNSINGNSLDLRMLSSSQYSPLSESYESLARSMVWGQNPDVAIWAPDPSLIEGNLFQEFDKVKLDSLKILIYDSSRESVQRLSGYEDAKFDLQNPDNDIVRYIVQELGS